MKFTELTDKEFMEFVNTRPEKNFFQTVMMKDRIKNEGTEVYLVGVKENKKVVAASFIAANGHTFMGYKTFEAYKGFILDYENKELVKFMTEEVKKFLSTKKALRLIIDPYIPNVSRDMDANIVEGIDNRHVRTYLESLGYKYNEDGAQVKWCYCLDIDGKDSKELFNAFKSNTRYYINKTINNYQVEQNITKNIYGKENVYYNYIKVYYSNMI